MPEARFEIACPFGPRYESSSFIATPLWNSFRKGIPSMMTDEESTIVKRNSALIVLALALICAAPSFAEVATVTNGIDVWTTPADGSSYLDLARTPIPAGFLCPSSRPLTGRILWQGKPIASAPDNVLGNADTIVQRLDDVTFGQDGIGVTRLQVKALSLVGMKPIRTRCGNFEVTAHLNGEQPITSMEIVRQTGDSGTYQASLAMQVKLVFTPIGRDGNSTGGLVRTFVVDEPMDLESQLARWTSSAPNPEVQHKQIGGFLAVDTDGDAATDLFLPGQSNFFTLGAEAAGKDSLITEGDCVNTHPGLICHSSGIPGKCHCTGFAAY